MSELNRSAITDTLCPTSTHLARTKKKNQVNKTWFFYATSEACVGHRPTHLWRRTHTTCIVTFIRLCKHTHFTITFVALITSTHLARTNRQAEMLVFFIWSAVDLRAIIYRTMPKAFNSHSCIVTLRFLSKLNRYAITLTPFTTISHLARTNRQAEMLVFFYATCGLCVLKNAIFVL